jgi:hypothetical protein
MKTPKIVESLIVNFRGQRVLFDADLASLFGVTTKRLNEQVKRNKERFPPDFMFQITGREWAEFRAQHKGNVAESVDDQEDAYLRSQIATSSSQLLEYQYDGELMPEILKEKVGGRRTLPYVFSEHGALMAANVLNSSKAIHMSVYVVRAFIRQRALLMTQSDILRKLATMDKQLIEQDEALRMIWNELQPLLDPPPAQPSKPIGFHVKERRPRYGKKL